MCIGASRRGSNKRISTIETLKYVTVWMYDYCIHGCKCKARQLFVLHNDSKVRGSIIVDDLHAKIRIISSNMLMSIRPNTCYGEFKRHVFITIMIPSVAPQSGRVVHKAEKNDSILTKRHYGTTQHI